MIIKHQFIVSTVSFILKIDQKIIINLMTEELNK